MAAPATATATATARGERADTLRATLLVVLSACCFGSISPLTLIAQQSGVALQGIQAWRYGTTAVLLLAYGWWRRAHVAPRAAGAWPWWHPRILLLAGVPQASVATLALLALRWIPAASASFLFYTFPAWVAIITAMRGTDRLTGTRVLALLLALGGIVAMVGAPDSVRVHPAGVASAIGGALLYAAYIPVLERLQRTRDPLDVARAIGVGGAAMFLTWAIATGTLFEGFDARAVAASMAQGVLSAAAFLGFLAGLSRLGPVRTAITSTVEPFWTTLLGAVLLAQPVGTGTALGGLGIMAAVVLLQRPAGAAVAPGAVRSSTPQKDGHVGRPPS